MANGGCHRHRRVVAEALPFLSNHFYAYCFFLCWVGLSYFFDDVFRSFSLSSWPIEAESYRAPAAASAGTARSICSRSVALRLASSAPRDSSRRSRLRGPTRGTISFPLASTPAIASCATVTPLARASSRSFSTSCRFLSRFSPWKRGLVLRKSRSPVRALLQWPLMSPRDRTPYRSHAVRLLREARPDVLPSSSARMTSAARCKASQRFKNEYGHKRSLEVIHLRASA